MDSFQLSHSVVSNSSQSHGRPGFPVHHQLPELAQTHVHWVCVAIQQSHPVLSPFLFKLLNTMDHLIIKRSTDKGYNMNES